MRQATTSAAPDEAAASSRDFDLVWPSLERVDGIRDALARGWSPNTMQDVAQKELAALDADPVAWVAALVDREARGEPITLPDGSRAARLPGFSRWMWDGEFCGSIGLRWQRGSTELPPYCLGHIGYAVVPWKRGRGYATRALGLVLRDAKAEGLPHVIVTTDPANVASRKAIETNGGRLIEHFVRPEALGATESLRYRIDIA